MSNDERVLKAALFADVVGYSELMSDDEAGTLEAVRATFHIFEEIIDGRSGEVVKSEGDKVFAVFNSSVYAVMAAVEFQRRALESPVNLPSGPAIVMRVGVHTGDFIAQDDDFFGEHVNLAARIEPHAPQGGLAVSSTTHGQVRGRVDVEFESLGPTELKGARDPVELFSWDPHRKATVDGVQPDSQSGEKEGGKVGIPCVVVVGAGLAGIATAVRLLQFAEGPLDLVVIDENPIESWGGLAYGVDHTGWDFLLNIQAGRLSLFREHPVDFLEWVNSEENQAEWPDQWRVRYGPSNE